MPGWPCCCASATEAVKAVAAIAIMDVEMVFIVSLLIRGVWKELRRYADRSICRVIVMYADVSEKAERVIDATVGVFTRFSTMSRVLKFWSELRNSLWLLPASLVLGAIGLAFLAVGLDEAIDQKWLARFPRLFGAGADGSRAMLGAIATSSITVAALVFSITIAALSQASLQYTPRILRTFIRDRGNQIVLGWLLGIFVYCLVVLRTVRAETTGSEFVPGIAVLLGFFLAVGGIGLLIYFIHHVAQSLQAGSVVAHAAEDTTRAIHAFFPKLNDDGDDEEDQRGRDMLARLAGAEWREVVARSTGYVEIIDTDALVDLACEHDAVIRLLNRVGDFVIADTVFAHIHLRSLASDEEVEDRMNKAFAFSRHRTIEQDPCFGLRQIVDIGLKALSPSVNDTTTAVQCVRYLTALLFMVGRRGSASPYYFREGELRLYAGNPDFQAMLRLAFDEIAQNVAGNLSVHLAVLDGLEKLGCAAPREKKRGAVIALIDIYASVAERNVQEEFRAVAADRALVAMRAVRAAEVRRP